MKEHSTASMEDLLRQSIAIAKRNKGRKNGVNPLSVVPPNNDDKAVRTIPATSDEQVALAQEFWDIISAETPSEAARLYEFFTGKHVVQYFQEDPILTPPRKRQRK